MKVLTTQELSELKPPEWLLEEFYAEHSTTLVYGPWGLGKSFMVLDQVLSMSVGDDWYGRAVARPLKTLYIVAEGAHWWHRRIQAYQKERGDIDPDNLLWVPEPVDLWTPGKMNGEGRREPGPGIQELEMALEDHQPDLVVFDTWVRVTSAFGMSEDKATDTAQVIRQLDRLRDTYQFSPIIVHHPTKTGNFRGSGNLGASVERIIQMKEGENKSQFIVVDEKGNHIQPFDDFQCHFESVDLGEISSAVVRYDGPTSGKPTDTMNVQRLYFAAKQVFLGEVVTHGQLAGISDVAKGSTDAAITDGVELGYYKKVEGGYEVM